MFRKKICILGAFAVGKTSLVQRFVQGIFSEKYLTTLGVKIDKKSMRVDQQNMELIIWDLAGEDEFIKMRKSYLRGAAGYFLVVDGMRNETLDTAISLQQRVEEEIGKLPFILLINKIDLKKQWAIESQQIEKLKASGWCVLETSAKTTEHVEESFSMLAVELLKQ